MHAPLITKYVYRIRTQNGAVVDNLQIYGKDESESLKKLQRMYHRCEVLETRMLAPERSANASYEDVLDLIAKTIN